MVSLATLIEIIKLANREFWNVPPDSLLEHCLRENNALSGPEERPTLKLIVATYIARAVFDEHFYGMELLACKPLHQPFETEMKYSSSFVQLVQRLQALSEEHANESCLTNELQLKCHEVYGDFLKDIGACFAMYEGPLPSYSKRRSDDYVCHLHQELGSKSLESSTSYKHFENDERIPLKDGLHEDYLSAISSAANSFLQLNVDVHHVATTLLNDDIRHAGDGLASHSHTILVQALTCSVLDLKWLSKLSEVLKDYTQIMANHGVQNCHIIISFSLAIRVDIEAKDCTGLIGIINLDFRYEKKDKSEVDRVFVTHCRNTMQEFLALGDIRVGLYIRETLFPLVMITLAIAFIVVGILVTFEIGIKLDGATSANFLSYSAILSGAILSIAPKLKYRDWEYYDFIRFRRKTYSLKDFCKATTWENIPSKSPRSVRLFRMPSVRRYLRCLLQLFKADTTNTGADTWNHTRTELTMSEIYAALADYHADGLVELSGPYTCMFTIQPKGGISIDLCPEIIEFFPFCYSIAIFFRGWQVRICLETAFNKKYISLPSNEDFWKNIHDAVPLEQKHVESLGDPQAFAPPPERIARVLNARVG